MRCILQLLSFSLISIRKSCPDLLYHVVLGGLFGGLGASLLATSATAATVSISLLRVVDGTPNFDDNPGPGRDTGSSNGVVRVNDTIQYTWNYSVNNPFPANNVTLTPDRLPEGMRWTRLPLECVGSGSGISSDGRDLVCNLGTLTQNITRNFIVTAQVTGQLGNGTQVQTKATITADDSLPAVSLPAVTQVSALPQYDLRKDYVPRVFPQEEDIGNGPESGVVIYYGFGIVIDRSNQGKGIEKLVNPIQFTDDLSELSPNAKLIGCGPNALNGAPPIWQLPAGAGQDYRSVADSGSFACTQPGGAGSNIQITLADTDTTTFTFPQFGFGNAPLPANDGYIAAGYVAIWIPARDVGNGGILTLNRLTNFLPLSISNQRNFGLSSEPNLDNNDYRLFIPPAGGNFEKAYRDTNEDQLPTQAGWRSGDGLVTPGQRFTHRLNIGNVGALPLVNVVGCDKIDHSNTEITSNGLIYARSETDNYISILDRAGIDYFVEYAISDNQFPSRRLATCGNFNDATTDGPWFSDPLTVPGGPAAITKFRIRVPSVPPFTQWYFGVEAQVANDAVGNTLLTNYASFRADNFLNGNWQHATGDVTDFVSAFPQWTDRLKVTGAITRITQGASQSEILAGETVRFSLNPTITAESSAISTQVTITNTLPPELTYVDQSANIPPNLIRQNPEGSQVLIWVFDPINTNEILPQISFEAIADNDIPNGTLAVNQVLIESPDDATPDNVNSLPSQRPRYDEAGITIQNPAAFNILKRTRTPIIEPGQSMTYTLEYVNLSATDTYSFVDIIDVLPYVGDASRPGTELDRNPPSAFSGQLRLLNPPSGIDGITAYYTNRDPAFISSNPQDASNLPRPAGSTTRWCSQAELGQVGCPSTLANSTAVRIITPPLLPGSGMQTLQLTLDSEGNRNGDRYTNKFGAEAQGLPNPVFSNPAMVEVVSNDPALLLVKRITAVNDSRDRTAQGGQDLSQYHPQTENPYDDNQIELALAPNPPQYPVSDTDKWPSPNTFLLGGHSPGPVVPSDEVEYTLYFLSSGDKPAENVLICDAIPPQMEFVDSDFSNGGGSLLLNIGGQVTPLTSARDSDAGAYFSAGTVIASLYPSLRNCSDRGSGAIVVNLGSVPQATSPGTPAKSYGWIRFRARVK